MMIAISIVIMLTSQLIHGKLITIDTSHGSNNTRCCVDGNCTCSSLSIALNGTVNNTIINIVSPSVVLENNIMIGSGNVNNISIVSNGTVIMCNNSGSLYCELCSNITISGITWSECGNFSDKAGIVFNHPTNISLINNTFEYSQTQGVSLLEVSGTITVTLCNFVFSEKPMGNYSNGLYIKRSYEKHDNKLCLQISESNFSSSNANVRSLHTNNRGALSVNSSNGDIEIWLTSVNFMSNTNCAVYVNLYSYNAIKYGFQLFIQGCKFIDNKSSGHGAALYIDTGIYKSPTVQINNTEFIGNSAGDSIIAVLTKYSANITIISTQFVNNIASCLYVPGCMLSFSENVSFENNTSDNGAALYLNRGASVDIVHGAVVQFNNNSVLQNGGAIYVDLIFNCDNFVFLNPIHSNYTVMFRNNSAEVAGNSLFFSIPKACEVNTHIDNVNSIMYVPCKFDYYQTVNGENLKIPCGLDYTKLNHTGAPVVTSPHHIRLYFPYNTGCNLSSDAYFIRNNILGYHVMFTGAVFDYFGKPTEPTQFVVQCLDCSTHYLLKNYHILVDNVTVLDIIFKGTEIKTGSKNVTVKFKSLFYSLQDINITLKVELLPCTIHPGMVYSNEQSVCICYQHNVKCHSGYNEIRRGYWFGSISDKATTSRCPNHYCKFIDRNETSDGYFELPKTIDAQCDHHRMGSACGQCVSDHTLAYDSPNCVHVKHCSAGITILVIALTCLYWIAVVVGVFSLMYFNFQISSGYVYGIIYFYSMAGVLLDSNPYISDGAFQFVSVLSSFAQLCPQFLGELCFAKNFTGIDQLFIHYAHAIAVSLLLLLIIQAARCSARITLFISRCIIRVICLLILLSYTSLASTSLQLLRPLKFTGVKEAYTYSSPHIQYFHGRHAFYGTIAIICELLIVIGLPLLLLLEPILSRRINFIKIKPILDQFRGCYKDKHRWFAAYYLICRQVIFLIVYVLNDDYYTMLFYLQTACIVIAMIHIWAQPYKDELLNSLDGVTLLVMALIVSINVFTFFQKATSTGFSIFLVIFPLLLYFLIAIKKVVTSCCKRKDYYQVIDTENNEISNEDSMGSGQASINVEGSDDNYKTFRESLFDVAMND